MTAGPLVSAAWLAERLGDPALQVVDATWFMPGDPRRGATAFREAHIPGAVFFDIDALSNHATDLPHMLPSPEAFAADAGALGLRRDATVVVYDGQGIFSAPRVWWTLRVMGFPEVRVLDGGLKAWRARGGPVEAGDVAPTPTALAPAFDATLVRALPAVRDHLARGDAQVVDARPAPRFRGEAPEPRAGLRSGHMPGARNLAWNALVAEDGTFKSTADVRAAFEQAGMDLDRPVVTTCGSGVTAAVLALGLATLGQDRAPVYDGSWAEWGAPGDTPVVSGP
jgi:thiosulfate/3-mercaptopyruvate sulfurtransferase